MSMLKGIIRNEPFQLNENGLNKMVLKVISHKAKNPQHHTNAKRKVGKKSVKEACSSFFAL